MRYLLFPGRHLVNTRFQEEYLFRHVRPPVRHLVFAITSCNQSHSRYNPIPFHVRAIGVDRFARDFLPQRGGAAFAWEDAATPRGEPAFRLRLQEAMEFITKMSYTDNWQSEMREEFCFWELAEWRQAFETAGFKVLEGSRAYVNDWRVKNRFTGRVALYDLNGSPLPWPVTNMVIAGERV